eukprot:scaffold126071_cov33-Tisochrysis_lutea.AAC.1
MNPYALSVTGLASSSSINTTNSFQDIRQTTRAARLWDHTSHANPSHKSALLPNLLSMMLVSQSKCRLKSLRNARAISLARVRRAPSPAG